MNDSFVLLKIEIQTVCVRAALQQSLLLNTALLALFMQEISP